MTGAGALAWIRAHGRQWDQLPARIRAVRAPGATRTADPGAELLRAWSLVDRGRTGLLALLPAGLVVPPSLAGRAIQTAAAMELGIRAVKRYELAGADRRPQILARRPSGELSGAPLPELGAGESEAAFLARLRAVKDPQTIADLQTRFVQQLHSAAVAINAAKARDDRAGVKALLPVFVVYRNRYLAAGASAGQLSTFDKFIFDTGRYISAAVSALPDAIAAVPAGIFQGIWKAVQLPVLLAAGGFVVYKILENQAPARA